jgi:hypothetical protein
LLLLQEQEHLLVQLELPQRLWCCRQGCLQAPPQCFHHQQLACCVLLQLAAADDDVADAVPSAALLLKGQLALLFWAALGHAADAACACAETAQVLPAAMHLQQGTLYKSTRVKQRYSDGMRATSAADNLSQKHHTGSLPISPSLQLSP